MNRASTQASMPPSDDLQKKIDRALQVLATLQVPSRDEEWGAKVIFISETMWEALDHHGLVSEAHGHAFMEILKHPQALPLACAMIPEFRNVREAEKVTNPRKLEIIRLIGIHDRSPTIGDLADSTMYRAEKNAFYDADVYRTMLFLRRSEKFSDEEIADIRKWLDACPVKPSRGWRT
jgi:hypothetical protein